MQKVTEGQQDVQRQLEPPSTPTITMFVRNTGLLQEGSLKDRDEEFLALIL